ncbi:MAG: class I SAM-dependent methyltransferase [Gemmatimonadaceae bacterium]
MSFKPLLQVGPLRRALYMLARWRVTEKMGALSRYLDKDASLVEVGAGNCVLCEQLRLRGHEVVALDVENLSFIDDISPVLYDGFVMPFADDTFDVALLITVLHHCIEPNAVLAEARRVAKRILVIEEIYENRFEKYATYAIDSVFNFQFFDHPRSNKTDAGWRAAFRELDLEVTDVVYSRSIGVLRRVTYVLERT